MYCSKSCQTKHWKHGGHREICKASKGEEDRDRIHKEWLPPGAVTLSPELVLQGTFRPLRALPAQRPRDILGACWCCGLLLHRCNALTNPDRDPKGPFWIEVNKVGIPEAEYPSKKCMETLDTSCVPFTICKRRQGRLVASCYYCAQAFEQGKESGLAHVAKMNLWLQDLKWELSLCLGFDTGGHDIAEERGRSSIQTLQNPDLSGGPDSIAGHYYEEDGTLIPVTFRYKILEEHAFSGLIGGIGYDGGKFVKEELRHYTLMRLSSANQRWRVSPDYVVFSIHRLVAFGILDHSFLNSLPDEVPVVDCATYMNNENMFHHIELRDFLYN